jgi:hypothetical protein
VTQDFFPEQYLQEIIATTGGVLVEYRGQDAYFHLEEPTYNQFVGDSLHFQGIVKLLIGDARVFPNLEEGNLITVNGDDYLVATWKNPDDGGISFIALKNHQRA